MKTLRNLLFVALFSAGISGFAGIHANGFGLNGIAFNGKSLNGITMQGLKPGLALAITPAALAKLASKPLVK